MKIHKLFLTVLCLSLMLSIPCFSEEDHDHGHDHESHQKEEDHDGHKDKSNSGTEEKEDEYEDDRHIPQRKTEEHKGHDDHEEESDEDEEHEEEGEVSSNVGPGNAVTEADHEKGFKLSDKALLTLEIETKKINPKNSIVLPKVCVVYSKDETGIYRHRNGWFKLIEGHVSKKDSTRILFRPENKKEFQSGDQVVISGVPLLRVTELDAFTAEAAGHGH